MEKRGNVTTKGVHNSRPQMTLQSSTTVVLHSQIDPAWHCIQLVSAVKTRDSLHAWDLQSEREEETRVTATNRLHSRPPHAVFESSMS